MGQILPQSFHVVRFPYELGGSLVKCGYGPDVFVWTKGGYKSFRSIKESDKVSCVERGKLKSIGVDSIYHSTYSGPLIKIFLPKSTDWQQTQLTMTLGQRTFWFEGNLAMIGTAEDFYTKILEGKVLSLPIFGLPNDDKSFLKVDRSRIKLIDKCFCDVWGVTNKAGNLIVKSEGVPLVVSDVG
jgi:hypothetical protein